MFNTPSPTWLLSLGLSAGLLMQPAQAAWLAGADVPDTVEQQGRALTLSASGVGVKAYVFNVYVAAFYTPQRVTTHEGLLQAQGARRLTLRMLRDIPEDEFRQGLQETMEAEPRLARFKSQWQSMVQSLPLTRQGLRQGDTITLDWVPEEGLRLSFNRTPCWGPMRQPELYQALLTQWLHDDPRRSVLQVDASPRDTGRRMASARELR